VLKFAAFEVLSSVLMPENASKAELRILAHKHHFDYEPRPGFLYVRSRAISSRCNDNFDEFPAEEIKKGFRTFVGKPVFVNHNNDNHRRARGVVIDAALHEDKNPDGSPDIWVEALMEVDAKNFPKLAKAILAGEIARTSMGTDVEYSICSICGNRATTPAEYCSHIPRQKGQRIYRHTASGRKEGILVREICYGLKFFENSLLVEPPADPTAYFLGVDARGLDKVASMKKGAPFAGYEDFDACVAANQDKDDPEAYCGSIKNKVEGAKQASFNPGDSDIPKIKTDKTCPECGKPADHLHISPEAQDEMRAASEAGQMHAEMNDSAHKRVVNTNDPHDLKAHLIEAHDYDDSDFWRGSHDDDHPALKPRTDDFDHDLDHSEVHSLHNWEHGHGIKNEHPFYNGGEPGHFMGDSHFHTAKVSPETLRTVANFFKRANEPDEVHRGLELPAAGEKSDPGKELGRHLWNGFVNAMGFEDEDEMRLHRQNKDSEALRERFKGGSGKHGFEDESGGDAYYEVRHPSGWTARAYNGGPYAQVGHVATGDEAHDVIDVSEHKKQHPTVDIPHEELYKTHPDKDTAKKALIDNATKQGHDLHWDRPGHAKCKNCDTWAQVSDDKGGAITLGNAQHTGCGGQAPKMPDSYGHEDLKKDLHEWVRDYGDTHGEHSPAIQRWQRHAAKQAGLSDAEFEALTTLPPLDLPSPRGHTQCKNCGTPLLAGEGSVCPACADDGGRKNRQRQKLVRTVSGLRVEAAYYGEEGSHPPKGEVGPRGPHPDADSQPSWFRRQGDNYQFHADGDPNCEHQNGENSSWREPTDHCEGHHNPPHPMQAAIEKYNNYKGRRSHVPLENNTWIHKDDQDNFHIRHHNTDIISVAPNGDTTVNVNGYHTATTNKRLSNYLPNNVSKMRNPSRARGASEHVLAINPKSSGSGGGVYANWDKPETKAKFGFHTDTKVHDYEDGISFNAKTGEKLDENNKVRPTSDPVRPPQARGSVDPGPPAPRRTRDYYNTGYTPSYTPSRSHTPYGEGSGTAPGENYSRDRDRQEVQHAERSMGHDSYGGDAAQSPDYSHEDIPRENESFDDWVKRTTPENKRNPISKCDKCQGRGRTGPFGSKTDCRKCDGAGYLNQHGEPHRSAAFTAQRALYAESMRRYALARIAYGETKAPAEVDTLRDEECPVCGEAESYDGSECQVCGFIAPPKMFQDPDLDVAKSVDLRQDQADFQDLNGGMPDEVPGSEFDGSDQTTVDENGEVVDPAQVGDDGSISGPQVADDQAVVNVDVRTLGDEPVDPTQVNDSGQIIDPNFDPDAATGHVNQGGEPFTPGPNVPGEPAGPQGPEEPMEESPEAGYPGTPGDGVADVQCPSCGFQAPGSSPMSTNMNDPMAPIGAGDGLLVGDVCPNCKRATLISVGEMNQQEQAVEQMQGL
jgi:hypothetical protein